MGAISKITKILCLFPGKQFNITVILVYVATNNAKEAEVVWFNDELQDLQDLKQKELSFSS